jgi:hypothetical protein
LYRSQRQSSVRFSQLIARIFIGASTLFLWIGAKIFDWTLGVLFFLHRWLPETEKKEDAPCPGIKIFEATA